MLVSASDTWTACAIGKMQMPVPKNDKSRCLCPPIVGETVQVRSVRKIRCAFYVRMPQSVQRTARVRRLKNQRRESFAIYKIRYRLSKQRKWRFFRKKMPKYLQIRKKSLPLHPRLRKTWFWKILKVHNKRTGKSVRKMEFSKNAKFLKKYLQD